MAQELTWKISIDPAQSARVLRQHAQEVQRAAAEVTRINAQTARQAEAQARIQERAAKRLADEKIKEGRRGLREIERQLAQEVRANREAQRQIQQAAIASQQRRSAMFAGAAGGVAALIGVSAISEIRNAASAWVDYSSKLENTKIAFTTMLGSAQLAEQHLKELQRFALTTPFQFGELIDASQRMQALGFNASQVIPILTDVGNAVAAAGGGSERLDRVVLALSQIQSKGKLATQEINQLAESGIPVYKMLEEQLGKSRAELVKLVESGQISSQVFLDAFQKFSQQNFGGLMEAQSKTFTGAMSNIKDALLQTSATAFAPLYARLSETARELAKLSTTSKEFQANLTTAGNQVLQVWDGAVMVFYAARDAYRILSAALIGQTQAIIDLFQALVHVIRAAYHELVAWGLLLQGDLAGALREHQVAQDHVAFAIRETTNAAIAQGAAAREIGRAWQEASDRTVGAVGRMAQAIALASLPPQTMGGSMILSGGLQPGAARGASVGGGGGRGGGARERVSEGQRLLNQLTEEYNRLLAIANPLTKTQEVEQELLAGKYRAATPALRELILTKAAEIEVAKQEIATNKALQESWHQTAVEVNRQLSARTSLEADITRELQQQRDALNAVQFGQKTHLQTVEEYIIRAAAEAEAVGGVTAKMRELFAILIQIAIKQDEIAAMETWKKVGEQIGFPKSVDLEGEEELKELGIWDSAIGALEDRIGNLLEPMKAFHDAANLYVVGAFHGMAEAATDAVQAWILYGGSLGKALKQALAAELAAIAARAAIQAALHAAYAIGSLAFGNFAAAAQHGLAAAKFAAVAALTGIAARGLAVSAAGAQSGGVTAGSAFQSASQPRSTAGQPTTIDVNRRTSAQPAIHVTVRLQGDIATDALKTRVVDAVVESLDLNDTRLTTQIQGAARRSR